MRANQLRLWFASIAYVLLSVLSRIGLHDAEYAKATCGSIRLKLLKIGARLRECPSHQSRHGVSLSGSRGLGARGRPPDTRRRNAQQTRHHPRPTETNSPCPVAGKNTSSSRVP
jgi:hypothetical protein